MINKAKVCLGPFYWTYPQGGAGGVVTGGRGCGQPDSLAGLGLVKAKIYFCQNKHNR